MRRRVEVLEKRMRRGVKVLGASTVEEDAAGSSGGEEVAGSKLFKRECDRERRWLGASAGEEDAVGSSGGEKDTAYGEENAAGGGGARSTRQRRGFGREWGC